MLSHLEYAYAYDSYNTNYDQSLRFLLLECEMLTVMPQSTIHLTRLSKILLQYLIRSYKVTQTVTMAAAYFLFQNIFILVVRHNAASIVQL